MKNINTFWLLTAAVFACLLVPALVQEGMFLDGVTYSAISNNMAKGYGSLWDPHYTQLLYPHFHEHPPLVFILQSYFFKVFGDAFYTERIYSLLITILSVTGITQCWRLLTQHTELKSYSWVPVLLWLFIPLVSWSYKNNLLENTMGLFTIFSVFFILKSIIEQKVSYLVWGSGFIVLAFLSKGLVGLFPLAVPILYAITFKPTKSPIAYAVYLFILTAGFACLLSIGIPELKNNIVSYFNQQLFPALSNQREITTDNRFSILLKLVIELSIPILVLMYFAIQQGQKDKNRAFFDNSNALFFLLTGICASLPLVVSLKQRSFYLIPSIPFYILAIAFFIVPFLKEKLDQLPAPALTWIKRTSIAALLFVLLFSVTQFGHFSRDKEKLSDIYAISGVIPQGTIISTTKSLCSDWGLIAYMSRIGYISLDCNSDREFILMENSVPAPTGPDGYEKMDVKLAQYVLFKKR